MVDLFTLSPDIEDIDQDCNSRFSLFYLICSLYVFVVCAHAEDCVVHFLLT